jgi:hypothetical protein
MPHRTWRTHARAKMPMPYALIALLAALIATGWFVLVTNASPASKILVAAVCACSLVCRFSFPQWELIGLLLQVVLVIGIVLYAKVHP